jgi:hypothetical protein
MTGKKIIRISDNGPGRPDLARTLIPAILWMAIGIFGGGCATGVRLLKDEIPKYPDEKYMDVVRPSTVIGVVLAPEEGIIYDTLNDRLYPRLTQGVIPKVVTYDTLGAEVDVDDQIVTGVSESGSLFKKDFVNILYLQVKETDLAKQFITPMELSCDREAAEADPRRRIKRGSSTCWDVVEFDRDGGRYDSLSQSLIGVTRRGTYVAIRNEDILYARIWRPDKYKTIRFGVGALVLFAFANGAFHFWDIY